MKEAKLVWLESSHRSPSSFTASLDATRPFKSQNSNCSCNELPSLSYLFSSIQRSSSIYLDPACGRYSEIEVARITYQKCRIQQANACATSDSYRSIDLGRSLSCWWGARHPRGHQSYQTSQRLVQHNQEAVLVPSEWRLRACLDSLVRHDRVSSKSSSSKKNEWY